MKQRRFDHRFVEFIPDRLEDGVLYVSMAYATVTHRCACGCGKEVVTPLSPTDWKLIFDGETVSLDPSIGNWSFPCRSHYFIRNGAVRWAADMTQAEIARGRAADHAVKTRHYASRAQSAETASSGVTVVHIEAAPPPTPAKKSIWQTLYDSFFG